LARGERWWLAERAAGVLVLVVLNPWVIGALLPESRWAWPLLLNGAVGVLVGVALGEMVKAEFRMQNAELKRRAKR
jgi:MFS family permease